MSRPTLPIVLAGFVLALTASLPAGAQLFRAYLSTAGSDANPCTLPQPCRLLPAALAAVAPGGEVWMLDSANYNTTTVEITKSVSILAVPGAVGSVVSTGPNPALRIATPSLKVTLRNLVIVPVPSGGTRGVEITAASMLSIEGGVIASQNDAGVWADSGATVAITGAIIRGSGAAVRITGADALIASSSLLDNGGGVNAFGGPNGPAYATVTDTTMLDCGTCVSAVATDEDARITLTRATLQKATTGLRATAAASRTALVTMSGTTLADMALGWAFSGAGTAQIRTLGNNTVVDVTNTSAPLTTINPR